MHEKFDEHRSCTSQVTCLRQVNFGSVGADVVDSAFKPSLLPIYEQQIEKIMKMSGRALSEEPVKYLYLTYCALECPCRCTGRPEVLHEFTAKFAVTFHNGQQKNQSFTLYLPLIVAGVVAPGKGGNVQRNVPFR